MSEQYETYFQQLNEKTNEPSHSVENDSGNCLEHPSECEVML